uniref:Programmed cell death protein 5 n=1 Tax=Fibrocapsa japonica TaxID=94617 RepID=A0A6U1MCS4_9STRA
MEPMNGMQLPEGFTAGQSGMNPEEAKAKQEQEAAREEQRKVMIDHILSQEAKQRLGNIAAVKPEKARGVEDLLLKAATNGQLQGKVTESQLVSMLESIGKEEGKHATKVIIQRKKYFDDSDDDNDDDLL